MINRSDKNHRNYSCKKYNTYKDRFDKTTFLKMYVNVVSFQTVKSTRGHLHLKSLSSEVQFTVRIIDINVDTQMLKDSKDPK